MLTSGLTLPMLCLVIFLLTPLTCYFFRQYKCVREQLWMLQRLHNKLKEDTCPKGCCCSSHLNFRSVLSHIAHEIKNPAQSILSCAELLSATNHPEREQEILDMMKTSAADLVALVTSMLEVSKLQDPLLRIDPSWVKVGDILDSLKVSSVTAQAKGLDFKIIADENLRQERIFVDKIRMIQVLANFVSNAIKFTSSGRVIVRLSTNSPSLRIDVEDSGLGIEAGSMEKIFEPFVQASTSISGKYGGTGLGLAISKKIAGLMKCRIEVKSVFQQGSTFSLIIPKTLRKNVPPALRSPHHESVKFKFGEIEKHEKLSVLIVEDSAINRKLLSRQLLHISEKDRIKISDLDQCGSVEEFANTCLRWKHYDIILMDLNLDGLSGAAAVRHMKNMTHGLCGIVAVTGCADEGELAQCHQAGVSDILHKPYDQAALRRILHKYSRTITRCSP